MTTSVGEKLEASRQALMDAIAGLDEEGFRARPTAGEWTAAEVLAHLLADEPGVVASAQAALGGGTITLDATPDDEREQQAKDAAQRMPVPQILHGLLAARRDTVRRVEALSPGQLAGRVRHPARGDTTVSRLFEHIAEHEEDHAAQIRTMRAQTGRNRRDTGAL
ncbi:MAG: DinB family protein [Dehalococcoidia bacterium]